MLDSNVQAFNTCFIIYHLLCSFTSFFMSKKLSLFFIVFLTPELKPITGGTYFPNKPKFGSPAFNTVLSKISEFWS